MVDERPEHGLLGAPIARLDPVVRVDGDGRVLAWSDPATELFDAEDPAGEPVWRVTDADDDGPLATALLADDPTGSTVARVRLDGTRYRADCYPDGDARVVRFEAIHDGGRSRAELERLATILDHLPHPVYALDPEGHHEYVNESFVELTGFPGDVIVEEGSAGWGMDSESLDRHRDAIRRLLSGGGETGDWELLEFTGVSGEGEQIPLENRMAILVEDGEWEGTFGTLTDVSDRRRREQRLQVLERVLRHNLRTEVTVIDGHAEFIGESTSDPAIADLVEEIREASERLVATGDRTREVGEAIFSSEEAPRTFLRPTVQRVVNRVGEAFPGASIDVDVDPETAVRAGDSLELAIEELVENAVVHNDAEAPSVEVTDAVTDVDAHDSYEDRRNPVVLRIADDGPGIPEDERIVVEEGDVSPLTHSDGFGLWTATWIVSGYGGGLAIRDRDRRGTVVEVTLPAAE